MQIGPPYQGYSPIASFFYKQRLPGTIGSLDTFNAENDETQITIAEISSTAPVIPARIDAGAFVHRDQLDYFDVGSVVLVGDFQFGVNVAKVVKTSEKGNQYAIQPAYSITLPRDIEYTRQFKNARSIEQLKSIPHFQDGDVDSITSGFDSVRVSRNGRRALVWRQFGGVCLYLIELGVDDSKPIQVMRILVPLGYHPSRKIVADLSSDGTTVLFSCDFYFVNMKVLEGDPRRISSDESASKLFSYTVGDVRVAQYETNGAAIMAISRIDVEEYPGGYGQFVIDSYHSRDETRQQEIFTGGIEPLSSQMPLYPIIRSGRSYRIEQFSSNASEFCVSEYIGNRNGADNLPQPVLRVDRVFAGAGGVFTNYQSIQSDSQAIPRNIALFEDYFNANPSLYALLKINPKSAPIVVARADADGSLVVFKSQAKELFSRLEILENIKYANPFNRIPVVMDFVKGRILMVIYKDGSSQSVKVASGGGGAAAAKKKGQTSATSKAGKKKKKKKKKYSEREAAAKALDTSSEEEDSDDDGDGDDDDDDDVMGSAPDQTSSSSATTTTTAKRKKEGFVFGRSVLESDPEPSSNSTREKLIAAKDAFVQFTDWTT